MLGDCTVHVVLLATSGGWKAGGVRATPVWMKPEGLVQVRTWGIP